ncbi:MAG: LPS export ABC transporter permease LptG [Candidatus Binatia bacterium]|nr:MAG: LPS export ABC transporter permease LptG [Candidatus Binatia bacterium]
MKLLDRYIARNVAQGFFLALLVFLAVFSVVDFMDELEHVGTGGYTVRDALIYLLLVLPARAYELSPAAALFGAVNGLALMAARCELVAMWAAGLSYGTLVRAVLKAAAALALGMALAHEFCFAPLAQHGETRRSRALAGGSSLETRNGFWTRDRGRFVNIRRRLPGNRLEDVYVYEFDEGYRMRAFRYAREAVYSGGLWYARDVLVGEFGPDGVKVEREPVAFWGRFLSRKQLGILFYAPQYRSLEELVRSVRSLRRRGESPTRYEIVLWQRLGMPLVTSLMVFVAVPFVLVRAERRNVGIRSVLGGLTGLGFQLLSQLFLRLGVVYALPGFLTALLPSFLLFTVALALYARLEEG